MLIRLHAAFRREQRFVDDASHELRTPLALLKAELEFGLSRQRSAPELKAVIERSLSAADDLIILAEDLLVLARSDAVRLPLDRTDTRVDVLVQSVVSRFASRATSSDVRFEVTAPPVIATLDEGRIRQALNNLIDNALWHTPPGGTVVVILEHCGNDVRLAVRDSGPGVDPEVMDSAFEPFVRGPLRRAAMAPGAGLGLTIVRSIAESHGGTASLHNVLGGGAEVILLLPVH
jgi:signal transduction histidine kinase